jgi:hypothetical protein
MLNGEAGTELLRPAAEDRLRVWPASRRFNKTGTAVDDPTLLDELAARYGRSALKPKANRGHRFLKVQCLYVRVGQKQVGNYRYCGGRNQQGA